MKRTMTLAIFMAVCAFSAQAQIIVDSLGKVGVGATTPSTSGKLKVYCL